MTSEVVARCDETVEIAGVISKDTTPMTDPRLHDIAARYIAAWNETDVVRRRALVAALWTEDAIYVDPLMRAAGRHEIEALIEAVQAQFPLFRFVLSGRSAEGHGDHLRFSWDLGPEGGEAVVQGTDFGELDAKGRLRSVVGFLDRVPSSAQT